MNRLEFESDLRREGYSVVNASLKPNTAARAWSEAPRRAGAV